MFPPRFRCLNTWFQQVALFGTSMEPLRGGALLEEVHHWGWDLRVFNFTLFPVLAVIMDEPVSGKPPAPAFSSRVDPLPVEP